MSAQTKTSRDESRNGSGASNIARTTLKIAVLAPMPSASVMMATAVKPGDRRSPRHAKRTSFMLASLVIFAASAQPVTSQTTKDTKTEHEARRSGECHHATGRPKGLHYNLILQRRF